MRSGNYELEVLVNGNPVKEYYKDGKVYVEGRKGQSYDLRIKNNAYRRSLAIVSIDGLSVIDGKSCSYNSRGYIVNGYNTEIIDGWRKSDKEVAKFVFDDKEKSYAVKSGKNGGNVGVIGLALFPEKDNSYYVVDKFIQSPFGPITPLRWNDPKMWNEYNDNGTTFTLSCSSTTDNSNDCTTTASSMASTNTASNNLKSVDNDIKSSDLGTGWGAPKKSTVSEVTFEKESEFPETVVEIYYASREKLEEMGIDFGNKPQYITPQAFPGNYCQPPTN